MLPHPSGLGEVIECSSRMTRKNYKSIGSLPAFPFRHYLRTSEKLFEIDGIVPLRNQNIDPLCLSLGQESERKNGKDERFRWFGCLETTLIAIRHHL